MSTYIQLAKIGISAGLESTDLENCIKTGLSRQEKVKEGQHEKEMKKRNKHMHKLEQDLKKLSSNIAKLKARTTGRRRTGCN